MFKKGMKPWNTGKKWSKEIREKISKATKGRKPPNKGIPHSEETKRKISKANTGKTWTLKDSTKKKQGYAKEGNKNPQWRGENVGYKSLHKWITRKLGSPRKCSFCKNTEAKKYEWANISGEYRRDTSDFIRLCTKCHRKFDNHNNNRKLSIAEVKEIKVLLSENMQQKRIAKKFKISESVISSIKLKKTWKDV